MLFLSPPSFLSSPLPTGEPLRLHAAEHRAEAFIFFEYLDVIHTVSTGEVEENKREDYLFIGPPLGLQMEMGADMISQTEDRGEIEVDGETGKGGHAACMLLFFILVGKDALCHNRFTSLVMELVWSPYSIIPCIKGQRGF